VAGRFCPKKISLMYQIPTQNQTSGSGMNVDRAFEVETQFHSFETHWERSSLVETAASIQANPSQQQITP